MLTAKLHLMNLVSREREQNLHLEKVNRSQGTKEDMMICSGFHDHSQQSVFWSLFSSDRNVITTSVESSHPYLSVQFHIRQSEVHNQQGLP
ncbi:hypothetical protein Pfo_028079 [Paulownia fortunei]|nr:hypothetical protein Pfo_028079 [Paulownia fortunei]